MSKKLNTLLVVVAQLCSINGYAAEFSCSAQYSEGIRVCIDWSGNPPELEEKLKNQCSGLFSGEFATQACDESAFEGYCLNSTTLGKGEKIQFKHYSNTLEDMSKADLQLACESEKGQWFNLP